MRHGSRDPRFIPASARSMNRERCSGCVMLLTGRPNGTRAEYLTTSSICDCMVLSKVSWKEIEKEKEGKISLSNKFLVSLCITTCFPTKIIPGFNESHNTSFEYFTFDMIRNDMWHTSVRHYSFSLESFYYYICIIILHYFASFNKCLAFSLIYCYLVDDILFYCIVRKNM